MCVGYKIYFKVAITLSLCFVIGADDRVESGYKTNHDHNEEDYYSRWLFVCRWPQSHITEPPVILFEKRMHQTFDNTEG